MFNTLPCILRDMNKNAFIVMTNHIIRLSLCFVPNACVHARGLSRRRATHCWLSSLLGAQMRSLCASRKPCFIGFNIQSSNLLIVVAEPKLNSSFRHTFRSSTGGLQVRPDSCLQRTIRNIYR